MADNTEIVKIHDDNNNQVSIYTKDGIESYVNPKIENLEAKKIDATDVYSKSEADTVFETKEGVAASMQDAITNALKDGDLNLVTRDELQTEINARIVADDIISSKISKWIEDHDLSIDKACCDVRTKVIYLDASNQEHILLLNGEVISTTEADGQTTIKWISNNSITHEYEEHSETIPGKIIAMHRERACGEGDYLELNNLPTITYTDEKGTHTVNIQGDITAVLKQLIATETVHTYADLKDKPKVKYNNIKGETIEKEIPAPEDVLDLTDLCYGKKNSVITYITDTNEKVIVELNGYVEEYFYREDTKDTLLNYVDDEGNHLSIVYPGDVVEVKFGYITDTGTKDYTKLERLPTITITDKETGTSVTKVFVNKRTDDITDLLDDWIIGTKSLEPIDNETVEDIWQNN